MELRFQWQGGKQVPGASPLLHPCSDCRGLKDGTRSGQEPHEYLLCIGHSDSEPHTEIYRCLVCDSTLTRELDGMSSIWS